MFTSVVGGIKHGPWKTFTEAFVSFFPRVVVAIEQEISLRALDISSWIEGEFDGTKFLLPLFPARDFAYEVGILISDGEFQSPLPEVDPAEVRRVFLARATVTIMAAQGKARRNPASE